LEITYPWVFLIFIFYFICEKYCPPSRMAIYFPHFEFTNKMPTDRWLRALIVFSLLTALSNPYIHKEFIQNNKGDAIVLSIDSSGSMAEYDKFTIVQKVANDFIKRRINDEIGLVIFGTNAFIASPLTRNRDFVRDILNRAYVGIAGRNTAILDSLLQSVRLLKDSKAKTKIIILLTDGMDNSSKIGINDIIQELQKYNIKVYTIGIGDETVVNYNLLRYISKKTGGKTFEALSPKDISDIYNTIDKLEKTDIKNKIIYKEYLYIYPLGFAILLLLIYVGRRRW